MQIKEKKIKRAGHGESRFLTSTFSCVNERRLKMTVLLSRPDLFNFASSDDPSQLRMPRNQQEADEMMAATLRMAANRPQNLLEVRFVLFLFPKTRRADFLSPFYLCLTSRLQPLKFSTLTFIKLPSQLSRG